MFLPLRRRRLRRCRTIEIDWNGRQLWNDEIVDFDEGECKTKYTKW